MSRPAVSRAVVAMPGVATPSREIGKTSSAPGGRSTYWLLWVLLGTMTALFAPFAWHRNTAGFLSDDGVYLIMADFFSPFFHGNALVPSFMMSRTRFPPALPILIGLFGGGSQNMYAAHLVVFATFLASAALFYAWARRRLGRRDLAAACLLIYALLPRTLIYVAEIWSEYLYMALVFATLLLLETVRRSRQPSRELLCACALIIGLCMLTRTVGVALFAVFIFFLYVNAIRRKYLYILLAAVLPLGWEAIKLLNHYQGGYLEDLGRYLSPAGAEHLIVAGIAHNARLLWQSFGRHFSVSAGSPWVARALVAGLGLLALPGAIRRPLRAAEDSSYVVVYIAIILVWPHPAEDIRFLYPLIPLSLVYMFAGLSEVIPKTRTRARSLTQAGLVLLLLVMVLPNALFVIRRFLTPVPDYVPDAYRHTRQFLRGGLERAYHDAEQMNAVVQLLKRTGRHIDPHQCVYSAHPVLTMLYSHRVSILMPPHASIPKLKGCPYLFVMNLQTFYRPDYPLRQVNVRHLKLLDLQRDRHGQAQAFLFRIEH